MTRRLQAVRDPKLEARVIERLAMVYEDGPSDEEDRPPHVRAASGLSVFREYLAVIQDDANWLALIDSEQRVLAVPLPPGPSGARTFSSERGNQDDKYDLEACITVPGKGGLELIGFSSGSRAGREWILRVCEDSASPDPNDLKAEFIEANRFYEALRSNTDFCGSGLNVEGAVAIDQERIMLFQRGNAEPCGGLEPVDSTAEISWPALAAHLADPEGVAPPPLENVTAYDLGSLDGVRLTFSDAEHLGGGRILYSASAEDSESDRIAGSVLGVIEPHGRVCWTELTDQDGTAFRGKIEGLTRDVHDSSKMHFVIDDDDAEVPSEIYAAILSERFFSAAAG
ncbi:MAG TPA: hypothetical protein VGR19_01635 [Allosphingosinicella sp.]|nr:hypothetical protein [Allosphingosinicella sp.]